MAEKGTGEANSLSESHPYFPQNTSIYSFISYIDFIIHFIIQQQSYCLYLRPTVQSTCVSPHVFQSVHLQWWQSLSLCDNFPLSCILWVKWPRSNCSALDERWCPCPCLSLLFFFVISSWWEVITTWLKEKISLIKKIWIILFYFMLIHSYTQKPTTKHRTAEKCILSAHTKTALFKYAFTIYIQCLSATH